MATRNGTERLFGFAAELPGHQLPTNGDILRYCEFVKLQHRTEPNWNHEELSNREMQKIVASEVIAKYDFATVAVLSTERCHQKVIEEWRKAQRLNCDKAKKCFPTKLESAKINCGKLFDVVDDKNLNPLEKDFVDDQRSGRKMFIEKLDKQEFQKRKKHLKRKLQEQQRETKEKTRKIAQKTVCELPS